MRVFVDTSALLSVLDADDSHHFATGPTWARAIAEDWLLVTTNYVVLESIALVQHRLGLAAVQALCDDMLPLIDLHWVDDTLHAAAVTALLAARRRRLSLVDCVSFAAMRRLRLATAFSLDPHFAEQGFTCLPERASER